MANYSKNWRLILVLPVWVFAGFWSAQLLVAGVVSLLVAVGVKFDILSQAVFSTVVAVIVYALAILIVVGVPWVLWRRKTSSQELGVNDWPSWLDIGLSLPAIAVYFILSGSLMYLATNFLAVDATQSQQLPFDRNLVYGQAQLLLIFFTLVVLAPLAEELLFRGYLYGKLRKISPFIVTALITSLVFGVAHLWAGPGSPLQWAVTIDTFALSLMLCLLREYTGAIWAGVFVHMIKNGLAFYLLFVNPGILDQLTAGIIGLF